jgi:DNA-binding NtrC family response regulator
VSGSARILVIDDDRDVLKVFSALLRDAGYVVDTAENGNDAIKKSNSNFYNLALIDIRLPDMEGTKLLTDIKKTTPRMIKVIVTGYPNLQNAVDAINRGADGYIIKPARAQDLLKMVREQLEKQQEEKEYAEEKIKDYVDSRVKELESKEKHAGKTWKSQ